MVFLKKYGAYGIPVCLLLVSLLLYPRLPNELPMQFSLSGEVNRTMNKEFAIWCIPVLEAVILLYTDCTDNRIAGLAIAILPENVIQMVLFLDRGGESNERCERRYQKDSTNFTPCKF